MKNIVCVLTKFCIPLILSGILQQLYNWADAFIIGNVEGDLALAAVGSTTTVINFYVNTVNGFAIGLSILFAQKYGKKEYSALPSLLSTFTVILGLLFLVVSAAGFFCTYSMLKLLHTTADTINQAESYLKIIFIGFPFLAVYNVYSAALRGLGDSKTAFYSVLISSFVNIALDIWFVAGLGLSVSGASAATVASQIAMTVFIVVYTPIKHKVLKSNNKLFDKDMFCEGCRFGLPSCIQSGVSSAGNIVLQKFMNGFGTPTVIAITTAYRVDSIIMLPIINLGSGISALVAQKHGSHEKKKAKQVFAVGTIMTVVVSVLLTFLVIGTGDKLIALFGAGNEAIAIGKNFFVRIACFYTVFGLATAFRSYLEGIGDVTYSAFAGIASLMCRIAASYMFAAMFSNMVIAYAEAFSWMILLILYVGRFIAKE